MSSELSSDFVVPDVVDSFLNKYTVMPSTLAQYQGLWNKWLDYCDSDNDADTKGDYYLSLSPVSEKPGKIAAFMVYLRSNTQFKHARIGALLAAMKHFFTLQGFDVGCFDHPLIERTVAASRHLPDEPSTRFLVSGSNKSSSLSWDDLQKLPPQAWNDEHLLEIGVFVACNLAYHLCLRASEYTASSFYERSTRHAIHVEDVLFEIREKGSGQESYIPAMKWSSGLSHLLKGVMISIRSSKTDQTSLGSHHYIDRDSNQRQRTLVDHLAWWAANALISHGELFFRFDAKMFELPKRSITRRDISARLKRLAVFIGLDPKSFSSHSLRVGGAEAMKRSGYSSEDINRLGRWSQQSTSAVKYRSPTIVLKGALSSPSDPIPVELTTASLPIKRMEAVMKQSTRILPLNTWDQLAAIKRVRFQTTDHHVIEHE
jgi:hypothetical protein